MPPYDAVKLASCDGVISSDTFTISTFKKGIYTMIMKNNHKGRCISTYSIVGCDPAAEEVGVAVQSKFPAVGSAVPWGKGGVGAVATQAWANLSYGNKGIELMEKGLHPEEVIRELIGGDDGRDVRQVGIVDIKGRSATFTGKDCTNWAGGIAGENFAAQGNILTGANVVDAIADTFVKTKGDLAEKLMKSLTAGQNAGGDSRGMQSSALYIVKVGAGYGGHSDRLLDLRVDDHKNPIEELNRLLEMSRFYFGKTKEGNLSKIEGGIKDFILGIISKKGFYTGVDLADWNQEMHDAFQLFSLTENYDERLAPFGMIDNEVLDFMKKSF